MAMGNLLRRHRNKKEKRRRAMSMAAKAAAEKVVLQSQDGEEWVVSKAAASRYGDTIEVAIMSGHYDDDYIQTRRSCNMGYRLISLFVESSDLAKVIHFCDQLASDPGWDTAGFVRGLDHAMLFDLLLAAEKLQNRGLLDLTCRTINDMIDGKSPNQVRAMFGIRPPQPGRHDETTPKKLMTPDQKKQVESEERALKALHAVRSHEFTVYDPKHNYFFQTRLFYLYNYAFFDLDKESEFIRGPPLHEVPPPLCESLVYSAVNFISLKVRESDVGFPINVFGTVIARDDIDYRCVYLFRREEDDAQIISSPDETLTLMDPRRGLVPDDCVYFEFNLKIKCDGGAVKDFSRGLSAFNCCRVPSEGKQSMAVPLTTYLSTVDLLCADVWQPLEASISMNILKGTCDLATVAAWNTGNTEDRIILYDSRAAASNQTRTTGNSIGLARRVVAVPLDGKLVLHLVVVDDDDETEDLFLILGHSNNEHKHVCKIGGGEVEVKVAWTAVPKKRKRCKKFEHIGNQCLLL